jgi:uncharacterized membrane protein
MRRRYMSISSTLGKIVKRYFVSGLLVVVPLIITYLVLKTLFTTIDDILQPIIFHLFAVNIPGLGLAATILLVIVAGILTHNLIGGKIYGLWEKVLNRVPLVRPIYSASKQLLKSTTEANAGSFKEVVMIQYPRNGSYALAFVAHRLEVEIDGRFRQCASVFVPNPPTPFTGVSVMIPIEEIVTVDMTFEQAIKYLVSGGVVAPARISQRGTLTWAPPAEVYHEAR